jgi:hypothetical protein
VFSTDVFEVAIPLTNDDLSKIDLPIAFAAKNRDEAPVVKLSARIGGKTQFWDAKIMRTDSVYDTQTRALFAIAEVYDPYGAGRSEDGVPLAPGLFVDAEIAGNSFESMIVLPRDGLRPEDKVYVAKEDGSAEIRTPEVLDTNADFAYLKSGVEAGEIIILSPVEESRLVGPLKVLDIKDTTNVLIDPPKPEWMIEKEKAEDEASEDKADKKTKKRKKDDDSDEAAELAKSETTSGENSESAGSQQP